MFCIIGYGRKAVQYNKMYTFYFYIGSELSYSKIIFILHFSFYLTTLFRAEETPVSSEVERTLGNN